MNDYFYILENSEGEKIGVYNSLVELDIALSNRPTATVLICSAEPFPNGYCAGQMRVLRTSKTGAYLSAHSLLQTRRYNNV